MKWGNFGIRSWDDMWKAVLSIAIVIIIIFMLVDFISWKTALDVIKKEIPTGYQIPTYTFLKGYGYVPLIWRGNFSRFSFTDYKKPTYPLHDYLIFEIEGHNHIWVDVDSLGDNLFYGNWKQTQAATEYIEQKREGWEQIQQPIGTYCEVWAKVNPDRKTILLFIFGEDRVFIREFKCRVGGGNCGGGYTSFYWS